MTYSQRDGILRGMGFESYDKYLQSPLWAAIRQCVLLRDRHSCNLCGGFATQVHHRFYTLKILMGDDNGMLLSICHLCHQKIEFDAQGEKLMLSEVDVGVFQGKQAKRKARLARQRMAYDAARLTTTAAPPPP